MLRAGVHAQPRCIRHRRVVTGITETATGIGGPPLALVYQHHAAASQRANVALCFLLGEVLSLALLAAAGRISVTQTEVAALLLPAVVVGGLSSRLAHAGLDQRRLRLFVLGSAVVSGIVLIVRGQSMIQKSGYRALLRANAKRLRGDYAQNKEIERMTIRR